MSSRQVHLFVAFFLAACLPACKQGEKGGAQIDDAPKADALDPVTGLSAEESKAVLAQVGDRTITLGEYALTLSRMGEYEKLRYQTKERQKELLDEMIQLELLAQEARRRGLDKDPEVILRTELALRDEMLEKVRRELPPLESFSEREVSEYYEAHRDTFREPERRRVQVIVVSSESVARQVTEKAQGSSGELWGELSQKYNTVRAGLEAAGAHELTYDLGFTSAPGVTRGENPQVPAEVRAAVFRLATVGDVAAEPVKSGERYYIIRLAGLSAARDRSLADADRTIRVELLRRLFEKRREELAATLRQKFPAELDEAAIAAWKPPPSAASSTGAAPAP